MSLIGRTVKQYRVDAELGRGQHSVVYKAWQPSLERYVALKVLHHYDQKTLRRFQDEARLIAHLIQHEVPNIRQIYDVGQTADGYLFVVMEYADDSLQHLLRQNQERNRRISPLAAVRLLRPVAQALDSVHSLGWVHLDIKPQNILIPKAGSALLADFGIAQRRGTQTSACTPAYASPEQAAGDQPVGPWSDIYSLGVVLYEMVAGHLPFRAEYDIAILNQHLQAEPPSPKQANPRLSVSQEQAMLKALAKSPQDRYRTAGDLVEAMTPASTFISSVVETPSLVKVTTAGWMRRIPRWVLVGTIVLLVLVGSGFLVWAVWPEQDTAVPTSTSSPVLVAPTESPLATATHRVVVPKTPTLEERPTATLAPTFTPRPRPTATRTPRPSATIQGTPATATLTPTP
jgi:serine/threonine-protein kinase